MTGADRYQHGYDTGYEQARQDFIAMVSSEGQKALIAVIVGLIREQPSGSAIAPKGEKPCP